MIIIAVISILLVPISGQNSDKLSLSVQRNMGTAIGDQIEGDFTIHGSGDEDIVALELYFNETKVADSSSNSLDFRFNTKDYWIGDVNITLKGFDGNGVEFQYSTLKNFLSPTIGILIIIGVVILIGISVGMSLYYNLKNRKGKKKSPEEMKKGIRIDIDKDFQ